MEVGSRGQPKKVAAIATRAKEDNLRQMHFELKPSVVASTDIMHKNETCAWTPNNVFLLTTVVGSLSSKLECYQYPDH